MTAQNPAASRPVLPHRAVDPVMLFFDLVYVFLITELSGVIRGEPGWTGLVHAVVLLALLYWQWCLVTIQSSIRDASTTRHRFTVMLLMLIAMGTAAAVPQAFGERAMVFAVSCWGARLLITVMLARGENSRAFRMDLTTTLIQGPLLLGGAALGGTVQMVMWAVAALWEIAGPFLHAGAMSTQRYDVGNVVERFSLLIIVALGETVVSIATPQAELAHLDWTDLASLVTAFTLVGGLWWTYFHHNLNLMEHYISRATTPFYAVRSLLVYGHLALVAGLITTAVGLHHVMAEPHHYVDLETSMLLCGGTLVFMSMFAVVRLRNARRLYHSRAVACLLCLAIVPLGPHLSGLVLLGLLAAVVVGEGTWETLAPRSAGVPQHDELTRLAAGA